MRRILQILIVLTLAIQAPRLSAYCTMGYMEDSDGNIKRRIPVMFENRPFWGANATSAFFAHSLKYAIDQWHEDGLSNFVPYYAGSSASTPGIVFTGGVWIVQTDDCDRCPGSHACAEEIWDPFDRTGMAIYLEYNATECPHDYNDVFGSLPGLGSQSKLSHLLMHELGHAWGLKDDHNPTQCPGGPWDSVMSTTCSDGSLLTRRDIEGLQSLYGQRNKTYTYRESADLGLTWGPASSTGDHLPATFRMGTRGVMGPRATSNNEVYAQGIPEPGTSNWLRAYNGVSGPSGSYTTIIPGVIGVTWDVSGAAMLDWNQFAVVAAQAEMENACEKAVTFAFTSNSGTTWNANTLSPVSPWTSLERGKGASTTYDPVSTFYLVAWPVSHLVSEAFNGTNSSYGGISLTSITVPSNIQVHKTKLDSMMAQTSDAPAIACNTLANVSSGGNCMMAWIDESSPYHLIRYQRFHVTWSGTIVFDGGIQSLTYEGYQTPTLAALASSAYPFMLGFKQSVTMYTLRFAASSSSWVDLRGTSATAGTEGLIHGSLAHYYIDNRWETHMKYVDD